MISSDTNEMELIYTYILYVWDIREFAVTALFFSIHFSYTVTRNYINKLILNYFHLNFEPY